MVQAEERVRTAFGHAPTGAVGATALAYLAEIGFHHRTRHIIGQSASSTAERILFAFENMPAKHRDRRWARRLDIVSRMATAPRSPEGLRNRMRSKLIDSAPGQDVAWATLAVRRVAALEHSVDVHATSAAHKTNSLLARSARTSGGWRGDESW